MDLATFWFIVLGVLWTGYFVLEGFDFGVGILLPVLGRTKGAVGAAAVDAEKRRRLLLNTIGPVWDGNEVWVLTAGGATFAAFPHWYATLFSGFYLPLLLILVALILRNLGFEYRHKRGGAEWKSRWDLAIFWGSLVPAFLWGVALTNIVRGVPIDADMEYTGNLFTLLGLVPILGGLTFVALFVTHGAIFVALKTDGPIRSDSRRIAERMGLVTVVLAVALLLLLGISDGTAASWATTIVAAVALLGALQANRAGREGWAFLGTAVTIALAVATYFLMLFPNVMPSSTNPAWNLTVDNASSSDYTLKVMTVVALIFTPLVLVYQAWTYWIFRKRLTVGHIPEDVLPDRPDQPLQRIG